ncbi:MAG: hypothetical protein ACRDC6_06875 [Shewanella sp.]
MKNQLLTDAQLFTIEALNKIQDFVWPKDANFACAFNIVNGRNFGVEFYIEKPTPSDAIEAFKGALSKGDPTKVILGKHPDWRNSLITREQFDSVDAWGRNTKLKLPLELLDSQVEVLHHNGEIAFDDANAFYWDENVDKWRYRKPSNAEVNEASSITDSAPYFARRSFPWVDCENGFIIPDRIKEVELAISGGPIIEVLAELDTDLQKQGWPKFQSAHIDLKRIICNNTNQNITAHVIRYLPIDAREGL